MDSLNILHASDLHLDGPVAAPDPALLDLAGRARRKILRRLVDFSRAQGVRVVLLPGDVFHTPNPPVAARMAFIDACRDWLDMGARVFISPGNHDPIVPGSLWQGWDPPRGVTVFGPRASGVELSDLGLWIAGSGFEQAHVAEDLAAGLPEPPPGLLGLACQHCDPANNGEYDATGPYAPTKLERLLPKRFAYWALGHWHKPFEFNQLPPVVMAGSPQGAHLDEDGPRGAYLIRIEHGSLRHEFHPLAPLTFHDLVLDDWSGITDLMGMARKVSELLHGAGYDPQQAACLRLELSGPSPLWPELGEAEQADIQQDLKDALGLSGLVLRTRGLKPDIDISGLAERDDVLGRMWRLLDQAAQDPEMLDGLAKKLDGLHPAGAGRDPKARAAYLGSLLDEVRALALRGLMPGGLE